MKTQKISLAFPVRLDTDGQGFSYVDDDRIEASCYAHNGKAVSTLKRLLTQIVDDGLDQLANSRQRILASADGHIFLVHRSNRQWCYEIAGPGRAVSSACLAQWPTIEDCLIDARKHIESTFGGVIWECAC